jgi:hypothetical protein
MPGVNLKRKKPRGKLPTRNQVGPYFENKGWRGSVSSTIPELRHSTMECWNPG